LERERKEAAERRALLLHSKRELEGLVAQDWDLFADYRRRIRNVLRKEDEELKNSLAAQGSVRLSFISPFGRA
jgi:hypothetical protein